MLALVTCMFEEDPIRNKGAIPQNNVFPHRSLWDTQGQVTLKLNNLI